MVLENSDGSTFNERLSTGGLRKYRGKMRFSTNVAAILETVQERSTVTEDR